MEELWARLLDSFLKFKGRFLGTFFGFIIGIIVLKYGWLKAIYFLGCVTVGYYLGKRADAQESIIQMVKNIFPSHEDR